MEFTIYVDNYRGFRDTHIPFKQVNFLVGENSTGKTSILALLNLLTESSWFLEANPRFNTSRVQLGLFDDIVSASSSNKDFFLVGYHGYDEMEETYMGALMKFIPRNTTVRLSVWKDSRTSVFTGVYR